MTYEKSLMVKWDEYAILKTAKEQGIEEKSFEVVKNLILKLGFSDTQAADVADVPISFVKKVRGDLKKK